MVKNIGDELHIADLDERVGLLRNVNVPKKYFNRLRFGVQVLDEIFGGPDMPGIMPGSSTLFTGMPGAGKSTMCLQIADLLQRNDGRSVLYNVGEENKCMVKLAADRIGIFGEFMISQFEKVDELLDFCHAVNIDVLIQDSLQSLREDGLWGPRFLKSTIKKLRNFSSDEGVTTIIVGHITKGGGFAGPQEIKHDVDTHAHLRMNPDSGNRIFELQKNRFGPAGMPYEFFLSAHGLDFTKIEAVTEGQTSKAADRREEIKRLIKQKLLEGEEISGYCFERFEVDCSGGFWRGMLKMAVNELKAEGVVFGEKRIDGRTHTYIEV
jgi:predicted ATP-dependent serine protease